MIEIYEELVSVLERGEDAVLATLISRHGSAPGALGAKMIVRQDGSTLGTIGGGCVEAEVWQAGKDALERGEATILSFRLTPADAAESGLICGGSIDILVEPIQARCLSLYRSVVETLQAGGRGALGTVLPVNADEHQGLGDKAGPPISLEGWTGNKFFAPESGEVIGGLLPAAISELTGPSLLVGANTIHTVNAHVAGAPRCVLIEPLLRRATVFLFGAGHLSRELA